MIKDIEHLKKERPDLVELFKKMTKQELLKQCYLESMDAINMENRVSLFMFECTNNMSNTNYTIDSLKSLISEMKEIEISNFCYDLCEENNDSDTVSQVKDLANNSNLNKSTYNTNVPKTIQDVYVGDTISNKEKGKGLVIIKTKRTITVKFPKSTCKNTYNSNNALFDPNDFL